MTLRNAARAISFFVAAGCLSFTASTKALGFMPGLASSRIVSAIPAISRNFFSRMASSLSERRYYHRRVRHL
jgi:hypothetical protein